MNKWHAKEKIRGGLKHWLPKLFAHRLDMEVWHEG